MRAIHLASVAFLVSTVATVAIAQPAPQVSGLTPIYLKQGQTIDVSLPGANLGGANDVFLTASNGLSAELVADQSANGAKGKPAANAVTVRLTAASDAELGVREMRVATPGGVSRALPVTVGQYGSTADKEPNNTADKAQPIDLPTSLVGRVDVGGDLDDFRFDARKGQTLIFDVYASRLGSSLAPVVAILDKDGREMPRKLSFRQPAITADADPTIVFDVPADGAYTLRVRDLQFRGGADYAYRIDAGAIPFVESIIPASGRRGESVQVRAIGYNLGKNATQTVDLTDAPSKATREDARNAHGSAVGPTAERWAWTSGASNDEVQLRFKTDVGLSNAVPFAISDAVPVAEKSPNNSAGKAQEVSIPAEVTGVLSASGEEDFYRFTVAEKQPITIEVVARKEGSPVDALLTLRDAKGKVVDQNNGAGEAEARISRSFDPGDYTVGIRDLTFGGGPSYSYRLNFLKAGSVPPDFAVRFMPDASRINRGGHARLWCEVVRLNGYKGDVAVTLDGLPAGVTVSGGPAIISDKSSGIFTLSANPTAALGNYPVRLKAVGVAGGEQVRFGQAEEDGRVIAGTYLTVLPAAPIAVESLSQISDEQIAAYPDELQKLHAKLNASSPELEKAQAEWEKKFASNQQWQTIDFTNTETANGSVLKKQPDGSLLQTEKFPDKETYTVIGTANIKQITAVRLEVLPDASLPGNGPGRSSGGNFVLSTFAVSIADKKDPKNTRPVTFSAAKASFEQQGFDAIGATNNNLNQAWAIAGGTGRAQSAWFFPAEPIPAGDIIVTTTLIQQFGEQHTIGRFRLSLSDDPDVQQTQTESAPPAVAKALEAPADKRTDQQKAELSAYYRSIAPQLQADRARLDALRSSVGPLAEVRRLEAAIAAGSAALDAERRAWEQRVAAGFAWTPIDITSIKAAGGTVLMREKDDSWVASGPAAANDVYQITGTTPLRAITAVQLEALPDERFPANGPGLNKGNFVLTKVTLGTPGAKPGEVMPIELDGARATFEQKGYGVAGTLDDIPDTGWAVSPMMGMAHTATFFPKSPIVTASDKQTLSLSLEFNHPKLKGFLLGRFRVWALGAASADSVAAAVPGSVLDILKIEEAKRNPAQKEEVAAYFKTIAPSLEPSRRRLAELRSRLPEFPISIVRNKSGQIPVPISRTAAFAGPVKVTLEGFSSGRDPATRMPVAITRNFDVTPLTIGPGESFGRLQVKAKNNAEVGTRMVVLRAEAKVGNETVVQYSPAFPLTVAEK